MKRENDRTASDILGKEGNIALAVTFRENTILHASKVRYLT